MASPKPSAGLSPVWDFLLNYAGGFAKWVAQPRKLHLGTLWSNADLANTNPETLVLVTVWWVTFNCRDMRAVSRLWVVRCDPW